MIDLPLTSTAQAVSAPDERRLSELLAMLVSRVLSPPLMTLAGVWLVVYRATWPVATTWALGECALLILLPCLYVIWLVSRGVIADLDLRIRQQRMRPYTLSIICSLLAVVWTELIGAPRFFTLFTIAGLVQVIILAVVTISWKISLHTAVMASMAVVSLRLFGPAALPLLVCIPLVAWSRIILHRHNLLQTIAGAAVGCLVFAAAFALVYPL